MWGCRPSPSLKKLWSCKMAKG